MKKKVPWRKTERGRAKLKEATSRYRKTLKGQRVLEEQTKRRSDKSKRQRKALAVKQLEKFGVPFRICEFPGCNGKHKSAGLCSKHYQDERRKQKRLRDFTYRLPRDPAKRKQNVPNKPEELIDDDSQSVIA